MLLARITLASTFFADIVFAGVPRHRVLLSQRQIFLELSRPDNIHHNQRRGHDKWPDGDDPDSTGTTQDELQKGKVCFLLLFYNIAKTDDIPFPTQAHVQCLISGAWVTKSYYSETDSPCNDEKLRKSCQCSKNMCGTTV